MSRRVKSPSMQLGFDALLESAEAVNLTRQLEREAAHLPGTIAEALPFHRALIERHHAAMVAGEFEQAMELCEEAHRLATKLNKFDPGILADEESPGNVMERKARAKRGRVPLWGQAGTFEITVKAMRVRIEMDGMFGICSCHCPWMGFSAHAVQLDKPFLSETGYRSFLGVHAEPVPGLTTDAFAREVIAAHIAGELKGKPLAIEPESRKRLAM
jgi:hypothetical protein